MKTNRWNDDLMFSKQIKVIFFLWNLVWGKEKQPVNFEGVETASV
jgi:hypothetical protein